jgi:ketosteroid isomerase-like protein
MPPSNSVENPDFGRLNGSHRRAMIARCAPICAMNPWRTSMRLVPGSILLLALLLPVAWGAAPPKTRPGTGKAALASRANPEAFKTPLQTMIAAEQAFAKLAAEKGIRTAFLANLSEDAVVFRPLPVNGLETYRARPESQARLEWSPAFGEIAASGDFGVTCGPWQYTPPPEQTGAEIAYGTFLSVWRRDPRQPWKVVLDCGVSHARVDAGAFVPGPEHAAAPDSAAQLGAGNLRVFDGFFARMASSLTASQAVVLWTANDVRYLRDGEPPRAGDDARNAMSALGERFVLRPIDAGIARSGDLGYTYGVREDSSKVAGQAPDSTVYVHIWRRTDGNHWKLSTVMDNPIRRH